MIIYELSKRPEDIVAVRMTQGTEPVCLEIETVVTGVTWKTHATLKPGETFSVGLGQIQDGIAQLVRRQLTTPSLN